MRPTVRAFVMLEPYAWKQARTVLRELGDGDVAWLPGGIMMKTNLLLVCVLSILFMGCSSMKKNNTFADVSGNIDLSKSWAINLPETFKIRKEEGSLVFWKPGFTIWLTMMTNTPNYSVEDLFEGINSNKSPEAYDIKNEKNNNVQTLSYRLYESSGDSKVAAYYGFVISKAGFIQLAIYFDIETDVQLAAKIHRGVSYKNIP